jgi:hypothetical protein
MKPLNLSIHPLNFAVCQLPTDASVPQQTLQAPFYALTRTEDELSLVVPENFAPPEAKVEAGWRCLKVVGPLDFALTGILANLATALAEAGVAIFAISTYDTDYILVKAVDLETAIQSLQAVGHHVNANF